MLWWSRKNSGHPGRPWSRIAKPLATSQHTENNLTVLVASPLCLLLCSMTDESDPGNRSRFSFTCKLWLTYWQQLGMCDVTPHNTFKMTNYRNKYATAWQCWRVIIVNCSSCSYRYLRFFGSRQESTMCLHWEYWNWSWSLCSHLQGWCAQEKLTVNVGVISSWRFGISALEWKT